MNGQNLRCSEINSGQIINSNKITVCPSLHRFVRTSSKLLKDSFCDLLQSQYTFLSGLVVDLQNKLDAFLPLLPISLFPLMKHCGGRSLLKVENKELDLRNYRKEGGKENRPNGHETV